MFDLTTLAFVLMTITSMVILVFRDWRINAVALGVQYLGAFVLVSRSWPLGMAVVKLIVGWMAAAALATTAIRQKRSMQDREQTASLFFRGFLGLLVILVIFIVAPELKDSMFPDLALVIVQGGLMLAGMSLMQLGTGADPYLIVISLLSLLSGFEVIHAALETSTLLTGLMAVVNLSLALVGVYFIAKAEERETNEEEEEASV
jgi:hypothetical protein